MPPTSYQAYLIFCSEVHNSDTLELLTVNSFGEGQANVTLATSLPSSNQQLPGTATPPRIVVRQYSGRVHVHLHICLMELVCSLQEGPSLTITHFLSLMCILSVPPGYVDK